MNPFGVLVEVAPASCFSYALVRENAQPRTLEKVQMQMDGIRGAEGPPPVVDEPVTMRPWPDPLL
jgi:hypothetical protein